MRSVLAVAEALGIQPSNSKTRQVLMEALKDKSSLIRVAAIQALGKVEANYPTTRLALLEGLRHYHDLVRLVALEALKQSHANGN